MVSRARGPFGRSTSASFRFAPPLKFTGNFYGRVEIHLRFVLGGGHFHGELKSSETELGGLCSLAPR